MYTIKVVFRKKVAFYLATSLENLFAAAFTFSLSLTRYRHISLRRRRRRRRRLSSGNEIEGNGRE